MTQSQQIIKIIPMDSQERFSDQVIQSMRKDIIAADGNEVFWVGKIDENGIVVQVQVGSRGNIDSVVVNYNFAREGHVLIHNHPSGNIHPSEEDQNVAANSTDSSLGFYIVNNDVSKVYVVVEPIKSKKIEKLSQDEVSFYLSKEGPLSAQNPFYEERKSQIELLKEITKTFNENKIGVFEAGTGVGKSFAYLIPSILWAKKNKERVVISTGTINLQQQIFEKDIPAAQKILGTNLKSILLKGRQNYLCLRRLSDVQNEKDLFTENSELFDKIIEWSKTTQTGSRSDLSFFPPDNVWSQVNSESDACLGNRCPFRKDCFVMKIRKEASDSNLIVVNHHLLFADIESRMSGIGYEDAAVLPPYKRIVFDEAHGIEESATSFFSETVNRFKILKQLNLLYRTKKTALAGFLVQIDVFVKKENFLSQANSLINELKLKLIDLETSALECLELNFTARITEQNKVKFLPFFEKLGEFNLAFLQFNDFVRSSLETISDDNKEIESVWETKNIIRRLEDMAALAKQFGDFDEHQETVFWIEKVRLPPKKPGEEALIFPQFIQTPLDIAPLMNKGVFDVMDSVVCTSATLRTGTDFNYWMRKTGISFAEDERVEKGIFESPFPYKTNVIFAVPNDAPFPKSQYFQEYVEQTVPKLIIASKGSTLVLFTSYESLKNTYLNTKSNLLEQGISVYKQGDDDRFALLEKFKKEKSSVLYATESFWEGVDVPGESLSQVIIVKLPFSVPNDPVFEARSESIEKKGGSPFMELSVPQAVIKFRQGFGRLMRRSDDRGVIIVMDRRIVEMQYGKRFTTSVPMSRRMYNPTKDIVCAVEKFFKKE